MKFVHIELNTTDTSKAAGFYKQLFAWKMTAVPGMDYTMIDTGSKEGGAGIQKQPMPGAPNLWLPYVEVASVKKTIEKAKKLGAKIYVEYQPVGAMGAIGVFDDPTGATIGVWEAAKKPAKKAPKKKKK